jgi:flagellar FliJ protein
MHDGKMSDASGSVRREQFEVSQKERRVILLRTMIRDFENMIVVLDGQIASEEDRTRVKDPGHHAYSTLAMAAAKRRQNLLTSLSQVKSILEVELRDCVSNQHNQPTSPALAASSPSVVARVQVSKLTP